MSANRISKPGGIAKPMMQTRKMEKWKSGKMEKWKNGKMEKWKSGKKEKWKKGLMEKWNDGMTDGRTEIGKPIEISPMIKSWIKDV